MTSNPPRTTSHLSAACAGIVLSLGLIAATAHDAHALDLQESTRITDATITTTAIGGKRDTDQTTLFLGVQACREAIEQNRTISFEFEAAFNLQASDPLSNDIYFDGFFFFNVPRDSTTQVDCTASTTTCQSVEEEDYDLDAETGTVELAFQTLTGLSDPDECSTNTLDQEYFVRLHLGTTTTTIEEIDLRVIIDTQRPEPPSGLDATVTENTVQASWTNSPTDDVAEYLFVYDTKAFMGNTLPADIASESNTAQQRSVTNRDSGRGEFQVDLQPNTQIFMGIAAVDFAGNNSLVFGPQSYPVLDTIDFWEAYQTQGGQEEGGFCQHAAFHNPTTSTTYASLLLLAIGFIGVRRRRAR